MRTHARRPLPRHIFSLLGLAALAVVLSGCQASVAITMTDTHYDSTISWSDPTHTIWTGERTCQDVITEQSLGTTDPSVSVSASPLPDAPSDGCLITVSSVPIASADEEGSVVSKDGNIITVSLPAMAAADDASSPGSLPSSPREESSESSPSNASYASASPSASGEDSFQGIIEATVTLTFPGPVIEAPGARIEGNTATWTNPDDIALGVHANAYTSDEAAHRAGYAGQHDPWWVTYQPWLAATGGVSVLAVAGFLVFKRRRHTTSVA